MATPSPPSEPGSGDPLNTERLLWIFFALSTALLVVLALAPAKSYFTEWRALQKEYNRLASAAGHPPVDVKLRQIWKPDRDVVDRCVTCHLGMGTEAEPLAGHPVFGAHPEIPHEATEFGCTSCHQGQGRATSKGFAHGDGPHVEWDTPLVAVRHSQASCGTCHSKIEVPTQERVQRGEYLFDLHGCKSCHVVDGEGGVVGPDLSTVGLKGFDRQWHVRHLVQPGAVVAGSKMMSFGHLADDELDALITYMDTLVGAPDLMAGKAVANTHGCRSCHVIQGVGGDLGPVLDGVASRPLHKYDFTHVEGEHTVENWHRQHLLDPGAVVPGSKMPRPDLTEEELEDLVTYLLSLREERWTLEQLPRGEAVARLENRRDHESDGADVYRVYCSSCHGASGEGRLLEEIGQRVPSITNPDFLAVASDAFLRENLMHGRAGREMPAWGGKAGGLRPEEVEAVVAYLRSHEPEPPSLEEVMAAPARPELGRALFAGNCAACHGIDAAGTELAPSLVNDEFLTLADDRFLYRTIVHGRRDTAMPAHPHLAAEEVRGLMAFLDGHRSRPRKDVSDWVVAGSSTYGKKLYDTQCASCHGKDGGGGVGPALGNPEFLRTASDGFLFETIRIGRGNRAMRPFGRGLGGIVELHDREIQDIVTYLRTFEDRGPAPPLKGDVQGDAGLGEGLYAGMCAGCHGAEGKGGFAPSLTNPGFLATASDGFLQATILRGRAGTAMRSWGNHGFAELTPRQVNDITAYLRSFERKDTP